LFGTSATLKLFALDASTGTEKWVFDPFKNGFQMFGMGVNRGLAWHKKGQDQRLFYSAGSKLFAIDPITGQVIDSFGENGALDLHKGLDREVDDLFISSNTPGIIFKDVLIIGSRVSESTGAAPGHIRAFDVYTGERKWIFHTIPHPDEFGYDTWPEDAYLKSGGANTWAGFSLDEKRGIVYCPTGSAAYDFYGGDRIGENLFANSLVALDAQTGKRLWHFQTIHHDIWDKDLPAPPNIVTIEKEGEMIDAVAQISKNGFLFVFNRVNGEPIYPIEEMEVEKSALEGESSWPTQPVPTVYPAFSRTKLTGDDLAVRNEQAATFAQTVWENSEKGSPFTPPSVKGTIVFPGFDGGGEWGGAAYDPLERNLIINSNEMVWRTIMDPVTPSTPGQNIYDALCLNCHGQKFEGNQIYGNIPSLQGLDQRVSLKDVETLIYTGKGIMPALTFLNEEAVKSVYDYITGVEKAEKTMDPNWPYPYKIRGYEKLYAPDGYPMITPPWGQLTSIDLDNAKINWQVPLGEHQELSQLGMAITGTENYGGPAVTAGGLIFIAATMDEKIRAFDKDSGEMLWEESLPAAGYATPAVYSAGGRQFVVIACGGGKLGTKSGDSYVAFALPVE
jgi:quinoprotein glucose dehydrogenase